MKSKEAKANSAAKTDGAKAAPQQGSGESSTTVILSNHMFVLSQLDKSISEIKCEPSWLSYFPLKSAVDAVSNVGFKPEYITSALSAPIGGRLIHALDSYRNVTDDERVLKIIKKGYGSKKKNKKKTFGWIKSTMGGGFRAESTFHVFFITFNEKICLQIGKER